MMCDGPRRGSVRPGRALGIAFATAFAGVVAAPLPARGAGGSGRQAVPAGWPQSVRIAPLATIRDAVKAKGARAVLVNVWATFCEPCREEMPDLLRFYRDNRARGLRLVMISVDDEELLPEVRSALAAAARAAAIDEKDDVLAFIKHEDDTKFVNGLDRRWSGALPATFLYDGRGVRRQSWLRPVTYADLEMRLADLLMPARNQ
jgi:thiol-disulfide isomerase/thioredoxin